MTNTTASRGELRQARAVLATAETIFEHIEDTLGRALELLGRCDEVYRVGALQVRRLANRFIFEKLLISESDSDSAEVAGAVLQEPGHLLAEDFQHQTPTAQQTPALIN